MTTTLSINEYSDDESIYTLDSTFEDSLDSEVEYDSSISSDDYYEKENLAYERYLLELALEDERKRELILEIFGSSFEDSEDEFENKPRTSLYVDN